MKRTGLFCVVIVCGVANLPDMALRAEPAGGHDSGEAARAELFARLDANADRQLTAEEIPSPHARLFDRMLRTSDLDASGSLSLAEFALAITPRRLDKPQPEKQNSRLPGADAAQVLLLTLDTSGDGVLSPDEVPQEYRRVFEELAERVDRNKDQKINRPELARSGPLLSRIASRTARQLNLDVPAELARFRELQGDAADRFDRMPDPRQRLADPAQARALFAELDGDGDGQLVADEIPGPAADRFERLLRVADRDGDGALSLREFLAGARFVTRWLAEKGRDGT